MKTTPIITLVAAVALTAAATPAGVQNDLKLMQGKWRLVSGAIDGKKMPAEAIKKARMFISGNKYKITKGVGTAEEGTFTIDQSKSPKWLNATPGVGPDKGKTWLGIYDIRGARQKACLAPPGKKRPKTFASPAGSGVINQVWKKI